MYSKYLDYTDEAKRSHYQAQAECEQSDILISNLKTQVAELRQLDGDYLKLNDLIANLQTKYSLLLSQRDRAQKQQKSKGQLDRKNIIALRGQIDDLRVQLQKSNLKIQDLLRDNIGYKKQVDSRSAQIQSIRLQIKQGQQKNQRINDQNRNSALTLKSLKEQRRRIQQNCQSMSNDLDESISKLKNIQKQVRTSQSNNARLQKTLYQAQKDNSKLTNDLKSINDQTKKTQQRYKSTKQTISQLSISYKNLEQQVNRIQGQVQKAQQILNSQNQKGKQTLNKISSIQSNIRSQQDQLDLLGAEQENIRKDHFSALQKNKSLNLQIDKILALISQYQHLNKQLIQEVELVREQDSRARNLLMRQDTMKQIIQTALRRAATTEKPIAHLKM